MFAPSKPAFTRASATSRRALSNASDGPPSWACQSPATTTADQSENGDAWQAPASSRAAAAAIRPRTRRMSLLVVGERRGDGGAGGLGEEPALRVVELALGEGDLPAPFHDLADPLQLPRHAGTEEGG